MSKKSKSKCDHNCLECPYPDCISSDYASKDETGIIGYWTTGYDARMGGNGKDDPKNEWYFANRERILAQKRAKRAAQKPKKAP